MTRNKRLLQDILKDKIGFKGFIMSDWWSINSDSYENFANGLDMNMPGGPGWSSTPTGENGSYWNSIPDWINAGHFGMDRLDDAATRIVAAMYRVNQIPDRVNTSNSYPNFVNLDYGTYTTSNIEKNRQAGRESIVLLKNKDDFLPLRKNQINTHDFKSIAIIGNNAAYSDCAAIHRNDVTCGNPNNQSSRFFRGYTPLGWGSGTTTFTYQVAPFDAINATAVYFGWNVTYSTQSEGDYSNGDGTYSEKEIKEVLNFDPNICNNSDVTLVFIGANSGEEYIIVEHNIGDRNDLDPWHNGTQLVERVLEVCSNSKIVLVVLGPATVNIRQWIHNDNIQAILFGGMLGTQGGNALVDILFGDYSPSGHLPYVWAPLESYPNVTKENYTTSDPLIYREYTYNENLYIGQRFVDKNNKSYDFPFGFGLSYSTFKYSDLNVKMRRKGLTVKFKVKNTGKYDASVVPMVFLGFPLENYPQKVLKGFDKKLLKVDEETIFSILVEPHDLSYYDKDTASFVRPTTGEYKVYVSENARDDQLITTVSAAF
jgi:beta-glucosidase